MSSIRVPWAVMVVLALGGCAGNGTVVVTSSATQLWATDTATLTCKLTTPAGTFPALAQSCAIDASPAVAGTAPSPIAIAAAAGSGTTVFTAGTVQQDTTSTVTASWIQPWAIDPTGTTSIVVHPPRVTATSGAITVTIEPSVARTPAGLLRYTYFITTSSGSPLAASDSVMRISPTFLTPATIPAAGPTCFNAAGAPVGMTSTPAAGTAATTFIVRCNVDSAKMIAMFDADASVGGVANMTVILGNGSGTPIGTVGARPTGPKP